MALNTYRLVIETDPSEITLLPAESFYPLRDVDSSVFNAIDITLKHVPIYNIIDEIVWGLRLCAPVGMEIHLTLFDCIFQDIDPSIAGVLIHCHPNITQVKWLSAGDEDPVPKSPWFNHLSSAVNPPYLPLSRKPQPWIKLINYIALTITSIHICGVSTNLPNLPHKPAKPPYIALKELYLESNDDLLTANLLNYLRTRFSTASFKGLEKLTLIPFSEGATREILQEVLPLCPSLKRTTYVTPSNARGVAFSCLPKLPNSNRLSPISE